MKMGRCRLVNGEQVVDALYVRTACIVTTYVPIYLPITTSCSMCNVTVYATAGVNGEISVVMVDDGWDGPYM